MNGRPPRPRNGPCLLLFLDYDGTLVPIRKTPELARLHPSRRRLLARLAERQFVSLVSGRSLADLKKIVALEHVAYIANHGLEMSYKNRTWVHPRAEGTKSALRSALKRIRTETKDIQGVLVEDKGATASIHFRA